jgi:dTDP-4-amino-4,6-dideoxygalactose transaminase
VTSHAPAQVLVPFSRPSFDESETKAVADVIATGWVSQGPKVAEFERLFAARHGASHGVATTSCTTALHLAMLVANIGAGDEVICPSYSFVASANAALYVGATPVFADVDPATANLDPADVRRRVTPKTRALVLVHQAGLAADLDAFADLEAQGITIVEDAACVAGAMYKGRPIGADGRLTCFSFHPRKTLSTGEGGMLLTNDHALAERAASLRSFAANISDHVRHQAAGTVFEQYVELGYNYRMTDMQAAMGIEQLRKLDGFIAERRAQAARYDQAFAGLRGIVVPSDPAYTRHTYQSYWIRLRPESGCQRDEMLKALVARGISCRRGIPPAHLEPMYAHLGRTDLPVSEQLGAEVMFLPIFNGLTAAQQQLVIDNIREMVPTA